MASSTQHPKSRKTLQDRNETYAAIATAAARAVTAGAGCARAVTEPVSFTTSFREVTPLTNHPLFGRVVRRKIGLKFFVLWWLNLILRSLSLILKLRFRKLGHPTGLNKSSFPLPLPAHTRKEKLRYPRLLQAWETPGDNNVAP